MALRAASLFSLRFRWPNVFEGRLFARRRRRRAHIRALPLDGSGRARASESVSSILCECEFENFENRRRRRRRRGGEVFFVIIIGQIFAFNSKSSHRWFYLSLCYLISSFAFIPQLLLLGKAQSTVYVCRSLSVHSFAFLSTFGSAFSSSSSSSFALCFVLCFELETVVNRAWGPLATLYHHHFTSKLRLLTEFSKY